MEVLHKDNEKDEPIVGTVSLLWNLPTFLKWLGKRVDFDPMMIQLHKQAPYNDRWAQTAS